MGLKQAMQEFEDKKIERLETEVVELQSIVTIAMVIMANVDAATKFFEKSEAMSTGKEMFDHALMRNESYDDLVSGAKITAEFLNSLED